MASGSAPGLVPPAPEYPVVPLDGTTELRIHGVSGTPVVSMLHHPHPVQVTGDKLAGCYRRGDDHAVQGDVEPPGRHLEAYSWGGLTAGSAARALWLLLLPFMLANVASWAHPVRVKSQFTPVGWMSGLIRVFALSLTVTFMVGTMTVGMDLIAWQCANAYDSCASKHFFTRFMGSGMAAQPGVRIAIGALLPLLVLLGLWYLSRSTSQAYEQYPKHTPGTPEPVLQPGVHDFGHPKFWSGGAPFQRLRSLHTATALAVVGGLLAYVARRPGGDWDGLGTALPWVAGGLAGLCALVILSPLAGRRRTLLENDPPPYVVCVAMVHAQWAGLLLLAVAAWYAVGPAGTAYGAGALPGLNRLVVVLYTTQFVLIGLYFLATIWSRLASPTTPRQTLLGRTLLRSCGPVALATIGMGVAGAYMSGLVFRVADYLGCPGGCTGGGLDVVVDEAYYSAARGAFVVVVAAVLTGIGTVLWLRRRRKCCAKVVEREYDIAPGTERDRVKEIARAQASSSLTDRADAILAAILVPTLLGMLVLWLASDDLRAPATTAGTWLIGVIAVGLVVVGRAAYNSDGSRRTVGILWDLGTFWPRAAHPFAPPAYCERVVPEFSRRIDRLTDHGKVVISAHSQGAVIAVAAVHRLGAAGCRNVGLVTYGCPVERLYARMFPHFFGLDSLRAARTLVGDRWRNLYRRTDPIGGPVFTLDVDGFTCTAAQPPADSGPVDPVDARLRDPLFEIQEGEFLPPSIRGHSDYFHDSLFAATVTEVADSIP